jgi:hypothetical protein
MPNRWSDGPVVTVHKELHVAATTLTPIITPQLANQCVTSFFENNYIALPIVSRHPFLLQRDLYYEKNVIGNTFSLSSEYAILTTVADVDDPESAMELAVKARMLLDEELRWKAANFGSLCASVLLGMRAHSAEDQAYFRGIAATLALEFGLHEDIHKYTNLDGIEDGEADIRRLSSWSVFIFDR